MRWALEFVFKIYSQGSLVSTVRRTVNVFDSIKSSDTVGLIDQIVVINSNAPSACAIIAATVLFYGFWIWKRRQKKEVTSKSHVTSILNFPQYNKMAV